MIFPVVFLKELSEYLSVSSPPQTHRHTYLGDGDELSTEDGKAELMVIITLDIKKKKKT